MRTIHYASTPLAAAIAAVGSDRFGRSLMALARGWFDADQLVVFRIRPREKVATIIAESSLLKTHQVHALASLYRERHQDHDPYANRLTPGQRGQTRTECLAITTADIDDASYREALFDRPGLASKMALVRQNGHETLYLNLYRRHGQASFGDAALRQLAASGEVLLALIDRHSSLSADDADSDSRYLLGVVERDKGVRLSDREAVVCALLIKGLSMEGVALELEISANSAISYRRRAFEKLGISTQKELFFRILRASRTDGANAQR